MKKVLLFFIAALFLTACNRVQQEVPVSSISISPVTVQLTVGETVQLNAKVFPSNATDKTVAWASSTPSVATVSDQGMVTAVSAGTSTIKASAGGKTVSCEVAVSNPFIAVASIALNKQALELYEGEDDTLVATVLPVEATDKTVEWSSSEPEIAWVDGGNVTAIKEGQAVITAKAGEKTASCTVKVSKKAIPVESVTINQIALELTVGDTEKLEAKVKPDNATDKTVTWSSSAPDIAKVEGGTVTALKEGEAIITAKAGDLRAVCEVKVIKPASGDEEIPGGNEGTTDEDWD